MGLPYVKLESEEISSSKKQILEAQMNILKMTNHLHEYAKMRNLEFTRRARLKAVVKQKILSLNRLMNEFPQQEKFKLKAKAVENRHSQIEHELFEINQKLKKIH